MKRIALLLTVVIMTAFAAACSSGASTKATQEPAATATAAADTQDSEKLDELTQNKRHITIELEDGRKINAEIYPDLAPLTVENFIKLIGENYYDGLIFHRVIPDFMIQCGGYSADLTEKTGAESIKGEFSSNGVENPLSHTRGVLSMARTNEPDSASSQFFIVQADSDYLDGEYAAFGKVTDDESLAVVDEIAAAKTTSVTSKGMDDVPVQAITIKTITLND